MSGTGDYISREEFKQEVKKLSTHYLNEWSTLGVLAAADRIPAADVRPVVLGRWEEDWETGCSECSACGESYLWEDYDGVGEWNFCPNCGADMRERGKCLES